MSDKPRDYFEAWNEMQQVCGKRCNWMASLENCDCHKKAELASGIKPDLRRNADSGHAVR